MADLLSVGLQKPPINSFTLPFLFGQSRSHLENVKEPIRLL